MRLLFWIGLIMVIIGGASFFLALPPNTGNPSTVQHGFSFAMSWGDRLFPITARIIVFVGGLGLLTGGAVAHEDADQPF